MILSKKRKLENHFISSHGFGHSSMEEMHESSIDFDSIEHAKFFVDKVNEIENMRTNEAQSDGNEPTPL